jgi:dTDP-4-amino-4,6-dideoxygalactose transaminase
MDLMVMSKRVGGAMRRVTFNQPCLRSREFDYIAQAIERKQLAGGGKFTERCEEYLQAKYAAPRVLLTHSCTAALEMAAILSGVELGDEVIMPSFTFVSTANAFVLRGAVPVFVDIRPDTLNIDETKIRDAITPRTKAVCVVHYAGVACQMDAIGAIARECGLMIIEDAAQAHYATWRDKPLGSLGQLATLSFHETKNVISGEGGALIVNDPALVDRAEVLWQKGTNRLRFNRGEIDKYNWVDIGSSFLPSELIAAFLWAQLEDGLAITEHRRKLWLRYSAKFAAAEEEGLLRCPHPPTEHRHNGHIFFILIPDADTRADFLRRVNARGVNAVSHYVPLHDAPAGRRYARASGKLSLTEDIAGRLVRLPLHPAMDNADVDYVVEVILGELAGVISSRFPMVRQAASPAHRGKHIRGLPGRA